MGLIQVYHLRRSKDTGPPPIHALLLSGYLHIAEKGTAAYLHQGTMTFCPTRNPGRQAPSQVNCRTLVSRLEQASKYDTKCMKGLTCEEVPEAVEEARDDGTKDCAVT